MIPLTLNHTTSLLTRFRQIRRQTEQLCAPLTPEDTVMQPMVDVSPPKWHLGHTTWFFETFILEPHRPGYQPFHPQYAFLFNSYYNSMGSRVARSDRGTLSRPPLEDIYAYRQYVDEEMEQALNSDSFLENDQIQVLLELGLQHEQQHQELLVTDIKYILGCNPLLPAYQPKAEPALMPVSVKPPQNEWVTVPEGMYTIGFTGEGFCFDNELQAHPVYVAEFQARRTPVTNGEYLAFMEAGGYSDFRHWLDEGWQLCQQHQWQAPLYWTKQDEEWWYFTLQGLEKVDLNAPVTHVSFYEALAYANWSGHRLLTEFEWEALAQLHANPLQEGNFLESGLLQPVAAILSQDSDKVAQLLGNTWEWTYSGYFPYSGFETAPGALGEYNGKFMVNQMVLRGGSCATPQSHIRSTYRNFFHADKRWQFTGIRLAKRYS
ncbi:ergothioneine biosynthesis protein EgtB [Rufibacter latericius]|uniref:Ergothioneine biosynthesis protein EgtB n=1 Tax=Rufibacter latericius TaxID=2487040 RepID=A0A3M9MHH4_9BACT|nr:ergothioneine biosynthesis protein EgtB [Rufibacter latericius]RNI25009.1 ergothioneine biosynthesis protein EgtB [Rufibacter latericius]